MTFCFDLRDKINIMTNIEHKDIFDVSPNKIFLQKTS